MTNLEIIPASYQPAVEKALKETFPASSDIDISPLAGGLSTTPIFKLIVDGKPYVLKLNATSDLKPVADASVAPPLYFQDRTGGVSISGFIESQPLRASFTPDQMIVELAQTIKNIHAISSPGGGQDLKNTIDGFIANFKRSGILNGPAVVECLAAYENVKTVYPWNDPEKVFSHNDLNPSNILTDGRRLWIIDWDTAFPNDRYLDLAAVANFFIHTPEAENTFLVVYFEGAVDGYKRSRFFIMRQIARIIYAMLMLDLAARAKPADHPHDQNLEGVTLAEIGPMIGSGKISLGSYDGQFLYGKALLNAALQNMRSTRFGTSMAQLQQGG